MIEKISDFYNSLFDVMRSTTIESGYGGTKLSWGKSATVSGRLRPLSGDERMRADKMSLYSTHKLYTYVADITQSDRIIDVAGNTYEVKYIKNPMNMDNHFEIDLELVE